MSVIAAACVLDAAARAWSLVAGAAGWWAAPMSTDLTRGLAALLRGFPVPGAIPVELLWLGTTSTTGWHFGAPVTVFLQATSAGLSAATAVALLRGGAVSRRVLSIALPLAAAGGFFLPDPAAYYSVRGALAIVWARIPDVCSLIIAAAALFALWHNEAVAPRETASPGSPSLTTCAIVLTILAAVPPILFALLPWRAGKWAYQLTWLMPAATAWTAWRLRARSDRTVLGVLSALCLLLLAEAALSLGAVLYFGNVARLFLTSAPVALAALVMGVRTLWRSRRNVARAQAGTALFAFALTLALGVDVANLMVWGERSSWSPHLSREAMQGIHEQTTREVAAWQRVQDVARCVFLYEDTHADAPPPDLAALGPHGTTCLTEGQVATEDKGYGYRYVARDGGRFAFDAAPLSPGVSPGTAHVDEHGVIDRANSTFNPAAALLNELWSCTERFRYDDPSQSYPAALTPVLELPGDYMPRCVRFFSDVDRITKWPAGSPATYHEYELTYVPRRDPGGRVVGYAISARPREWGQRELRSYLMAEDGAIHGTPRNRAARADDPEIQACEISGRGCVDGPWSFEFTPGS